MELTKARWQIEKVYHITHEPFRLYGGWYCLVKGRQFGPWPDKGTCLAGFETEKRRATKRSEGVVS